VNCIIGEIFGAKNSSNIFFLNTSAEGGVELVREKIKRFCKKNVSNDINCMKLVVIDEADALTDTAQEALRRSMEIFSSNARFILICNFPSKIIESIQSRCTVFRFKKIRNRHSLYFILNSLNREKIFFDIRSIETLVFYSDGDLRKLLNYMEFFIKKLDSLNFKIIQKSEFFTEFYLLFEFLGACFNKNIFIAREMLTDILNNGVNFQEFLITLFQIVKNTDISLKKRLIVMNTICEIRIKFSKKLSNKIDPKYLIEKLIKFNFR